MDYISEILRAGDDPRYPMTSFAAEVARQTQLVSEEIPTHRAVIVGGEVVGMVAIPQSEQARMHAEAVAHNTGVTAQAVQRIAEYRDLCLWESSNNSQAITKEFAEKLFPQPTTTGFISRRQRGVWDTISVLIVALTVAALLFVAWCTL